MEIVKIIGIGIITVIATLLVKPIKPEISVIISLAGGVLILSLTVNYLVEIVTTFTSIVNKTGLNTALFASVLKIIGVGYLTEFSAGLCNDAGSSSTGDRIILAGKLLILVMALPIVNSIIDILVSLLP